MLSDHWSLSLIAAACQNPIQALGFARVYSGTKHKRILRGPEEESKESPGARRRCQNIIFICHIPGLQGGKDCFSFFCLSAFNRFGRRKTHSFLLTNHLVHHMRRPEGFKDPLGLSPASVSIGGKQKPEGWMEKHYVCHGQANSGQSDLWLPVWLSNGCPDLWELCDLHCLTNSLPKRARSSVKRITLSTNEPRMLFFFST